MEEATSNKGTYLHQVYLQTNPHSIFLMVNGCRGGRGEQPTVGGANPGQVVPRGMRKEAGCPPVSSILSWRLLQCQLPPGSGLEFLPRLQERTTTGNASPELCSVMVIGTATENRLGQCFATTAQAQSLQRPREDVLFAVEQAKDSNDRQARRVELSITSTAP